jgi:hypothetical protein
MPRDALRFILIRYDHGAVAPGVFDVVKLLQTHLAWLEHIRRARERDRAATALRKGGGRAALPASASSIPRVE